MRRGGARLDIELWGRGTEDIASREKWGSGWGYRWTRVVPDCVLGRPAPLSSPDVDNGWP